MFRVYDDFRACDENRQPYSFSVERHTETANMHAWVKDDEFCMASVGNRYILNTPDFINGVFSMDFRVTYMAEFSMDFVVCFGYDERTRTGHAIRFVYDLNNTIILSLVRINGNDIHTMEQASFEIADPIQESKLNSFCMKLEKTSVSGCVAGVDYCFTVDNRSGKIALERANFIGELILKNVSLTTSDKFETETVIDEITKEIPCINGGDIPYRITWAINKTDGEYYLTASLDGGTKTRKVDRNDRPGQYVAEKDWMKSPYIGIASNKRKASKFYLANGEKAFIDPNIYWDCQKDFFDDTDLPLTKTYRIPENMICGDLEIVFGYENLFCSGYDTQRGGTEFYFSPNGELLHFGEALDGQDVFELYSKEDKYALALVPDDCYNREAVVEHIKYNHYFDVEENIEFSFVMKTMTNTDYLDIKASLLNVYETETIITKEANIDTGKWDYGYNIITAKVKFPKMGVGVYKLEFIVCFGERLYKRFIKVFEVYDKNTDANPALAVGLPFIFSMPNEQKRLMRNAFDLWNPMKSCDLEHYYNCITDTPEEAQKRKSWLLSKPFKREWFSWIGSRTCNDWNAEKYIDVIKNCDYLFCSINEECLDLSQSSLYPFRQDHYVYKNFMMRAKQRIAVLDDFLKANPDIAKNVDYKPGEEFTYDKFVNLMENCASQWIKYQNNAGLELIRKQNKELKKINPNIKRAIYGPINVYTTPTLTNHSLAVYGNSDYKALSEDVFTGFAILEDYPAACAYQTYRGAFMVMTILLHSPKLVIYPEQYAGSKGGCIDGAVKFAHAPMGGYDVKSYETSSHTFEFVFNTSYRLADGYHYWNTYGFHRPPELLDELVLDWKYVIENKPLKPMKSTAFLAEFSSCEDVFEVIDENKSRNAFITNQSEIGMGLLYECSREAGIPNGFALTYDVLSDISADECDVLVLPSLQYADDIVIKEIRRLYYEGVNLIAVSNINGLEDLFGVTYEESCIKLNCVCYNGKYEYVRQNNAILQYKPTNAKVIMHSENGDALVMTNGRTTIINTSVKNLGSGDSEHMSIASSLHIVGDLIREVLEDSIRMLSNPLALGKNVGVTLFRTEDERLVLLAIDYTPYDNKNHDEKEAVININLDNIKDVKCERDVFVGRKNGSVREIRFKIKPRESVFVELIER